MAKIKHGSITLPRQLRPLWENSEVAIREYGSNRIVVERVTPKQKRIALDAWRRAAGMLKGRTIPDAVVWQRKIRKEWERKLR